MTLLLSAALAGTATFDAEPEGATATSFTEDGVTVSHLDNLLDPSPSALSIDRADGDLAPAPGFTSPNVLTFGGYAPGDHAGFGRFGTVRITGPTDADHARVEIFDLGNPGVTLRLEAWDGDLVVATDEVHLRSTGGVAHRALEIRDVAFTHLRLVSGPEPVVPAFLAIDTVQVERRAPPEPPIDKPDTADTAPPVVDTPEPGPAPSDGEGTPDVLPGPVAACGCAGGAPGPGWALWWLAPLLRRRR